MADSSLLADISTAGDGLHALLLALLLTLLTLLRLSVTSAEGASEKCVKQVTVEATSGVRSDYRRVQGVYKVNEGEMGRMGL